MAGCYPNEWCLSSHRDKALCLCLRVQVCFWAQVGFCQIGSGACKSGRSVRLVFVLRRVKNGPVYRYSPGSCIAWCIIQHDANVSFAVVFGRLIIKLLEQ